LKTLWTARRGFLAVWDPLVRIGHWSLAVTVVSAWLTRTGWGAIHEWLGYVAAAIVALRVVWGLVGSSEARFAGFLVAPALTLRYARAVLSGTEVRFVGHNPLGGWMIVVLLACIALVAFTGYLSTTDRYWGVAWVESLHAVLADALMILILVHVAGVVHASWRHRENLVAAMIHGRKRAATPTSAPPDHP
jgi:cytochrome b